jgi:CRISPR-associated endonuclease/helicase Cas3
MAKVKQATQQVKAKRSGTVITDELVEDLAREAEEGYDLRRARRQRVGRPSLGSGVSPRLQFRVSPDLYAAAQRRARKEGRGVSEVARDALRRYVEGA